MLLIQLALVSSLAAHYLYQRATCPKVWTRAAAYDPSLVMRGRYLSLQLTVDGCQSTLPSALHAIFPRNVDGTTKSSGYSVTRQSSLTFRAKLKVDKNRLVAIRIPEADLTSKGVYVTALPGPPAMLCACRSRSTSTSPSTPPTPLRSSPARSCGLKSPSRLKARPGPSNSP